MCFFKFEGLSEQIAAEIAEQIITGQLIAGERIQEVRIANAMQVSRASVREALQILKRTGLINVYPRRGALVSELDQQHIESLFRMADLLITEIIMQHDKVDHHQFDGLLQTLQQRLFQQVQAFQPQQFYDEIFAYLSQFSASCEHLYLHCMFTDLLPAIRRGYFYAIHVSNYALQEEFFLISKVIDAITSKNTHQAALFMQDFCRNLCKLVQASLIHIKQAELAWAQCSPH
ncbi:hypothetical protein BJI46_10845 [Acinetobacter qingfengensis]|uniref:HTH gntR-type domain-containing protein n=1 Tax=Acinetobacter qingfengensis TaxID=1262585 RepID=A0A1E7RD23_9GAMM|nr:hypothetical protein BJI46_10845 [Acinetobacter qingfengensis]